MLTSQALNKSSREKHSKAGKSKNRSILCTPIPASLSVPLGHQDYLITKEPNLASLLTLLQAWEGPHDL